ncbi:hypothetical protein IFR05_011061 [Cadophora sp. M221]|nr:hypothetical protein IFR05_011061 [Cadophora sp. M221]
MHALMAHRTWKKRWIIPMWSVQIPLLAVNIIILGILIGVERNSPEDSLGNSQSTVQAWTVVNLALAIIALLIDCVEVSMYIHNDLSPKLYLGSNIFRFSTWIIPFAWNIYVDTTPWKGRGWNDIYLYVAIGLSSAVFATFIASLIYALVVFRTYQSRARTLYDNYSASKSSNSNRSSSVPVDPDAAVQEEDFIRYTEDQPSFNNIRALNLRYLDIRQRTTNRYNGIIG